MIMGCFKNPKKSKWFLVCFRPEESLKLNSGSERNTLHQNIFFACSNDQKRDSYSDNSDDGKSCRRRFHRVFKTIFSNNNTTSSSSKKKRNKRSGKDTCINISSKFEKIFNTSSEKKSKSLLSSLESVSMSSHSSLFSSPRVHSSMRSSSSSSSSISSMVSNSRSGSGRRQTCPIDLKESKSNKTQKKEDGNSSTEIGLYIILPLCLVGLIFWGKAVAIFCTSAYLFLVPCIFKGVALEENDDDSIDIDSDEYKKKVILEGLLDRNYTRKRGES